MHHNSKPNSICFPNLSTSYHERHILLAYIMRQLVDCHGSALAAQWQLNGTFTYTISTLNVIGILSLHHTSSVTSPNAIGLTSYFKKRY